MREVVILKWSFSPPNYFERPIKVVVSKNANEEDITLLIKNGNVEARVNPIIYSHDPSCRLMLHEALNHRFLVEQVSTHRAYNLSKPLMYRQHPDGRMGVTIFPEPARAIIRAVGCNILVKDMNGKVIRDTKRDRIERKQQLGTLGEKHRSDKVLKALLNSYDSAVNDHANELVYLFEIQEAISARFQGDAAARRAVGLDEDEWPRLVALTNNALFMQGRHRGQKIGALRNATSAELEEARSIARRIIEGYLKWLDTKPRNS